MCWFSDSCVTVGEKGDTSATSETFEVHAGTGIGGGLTAEHKAALALGQSDSQLATSWTLVCSTITFLIAAVIAR